MQRVAAPSCLRGALSQRPFDLRPSVVHSPLSWRPPVHASSMFCLVSQRPFVSRPPVVDPAGWQFTVYYDVSTRSPLGNWVSCHFQDFLFRPRLDVRPRLNSPEHCCKLHTDAHKAIHKPLLEGLLIFTKYMMYDRVLRLGLLALGLMWRPISIFKHALLWSTGTWVVYKNHWSILRLDSAKPQPSPLKHLI